MVTEQAPAAATPAEAAPIVDAENLSAQGSESVLASLLDQMSAPPPDDAAGEEVANPVEPAAADETEPDSSLAAEPEGTDSADAGAEADGDSGEESRNPNARNFRGRWDHLNEQERRVVELTAKRGLSLREAYRAVYGEAGPEGRQAEAVAVSDGAVEAQIEQAQAAVAGIEKRIAEVEYDPVTHLDLAKELTAATRELGRLEVKQAESARGQANAARERAQMQAVRDYPEAFSEFAPGKFAFNPDTELGQAVMDEFQYLKAAESSFLNRPDCVSVIVARVARQMGAKAAPGKRLEAVSSPATSSPAAAKAPAARSTGSGPAAPAPKRTARPVATGGIAPPNPSFDQQTRQALASNNPEALLAAMREGGTKFEDLLRHSA